jgi:1-acyl-sn-glycerol-3-phosphate acyltransferase
LFATGFSFFVFGLGGVIVPTLAAVFIYFSSFDKLVRQMRARKLVHWVFRAFIKMMSALGILTWDVSGLERLRGEGVLVLANHPTLLDVVFLVAFIPNADCIVKSKLMNNPAMRGFVSLTGYITNGDGLNLVSQMKKSLVNGSVLIVFPEGTRTKDKQLLSFQRGAARAIIETKVKPTPVIISCNPSTLGKQQKWYDVPSRKFHLSFRVLETLDFDGFWGQNTSIAARQLTRYMEDFFKKEVTLDEHRLTGN